MLNHACVWKHVCDRKILCAVGNYAFSPTCLESGIMHTYFLKPAIAQNISLTYLATNPIQFTCVVSSIFTETQPMRHYARRSNANRTRNKMSNIRYNNRQTTNHILKLPFPFDDSDWCRLSKSQIFLILLTWIHLLKRLEGKLAYSNIRFPLPIFLYLSLILSHTFSLAL